MTAATTKTFTGEQLEKIVIFSTTTQHGDECFAYMTDNDATQASVMALKMAIAPEAIHLMPAAPLMYSTLSRLAKCCRTLCDQIEDFQAIGLIPKPEGHSDLMALYEAMEKDALTAMQTAERGFVAVAADIQKENRG